MVEKVKATVKATDNACGGAATLALSVLFSVSSSSHLIQQQQLCPRELIEIVTTARVRILVGTRGGSWNIEHRSGDVAISVIDSRRSIAMQRDQRTI